MKTTIELPDELLIAAKQHAARTRTTLKTLITRGLKRELIGNDPTGRPSGAARKIEWVTVDGGLPPRLDVSDRAAMHDWLAAKR